MRFASAFSAAVAKSPPFGNGPRQGAEALGYTVADKPSIDNYYIWISLDYGLIGFFLYYGMIFFALFKALRIGLNARDPTEDYAIVIAIILTLFLFSKNVLSQEDNHYMPFLLMGMTVALLARAKLRYGEHGTDRS
jgi:O-antigen ligase